MASLTKTITKTVALQKFRPSPPQDLVKKIIGYLNEKLSTPFDTAIDVGCGPGKSTEALSPYFKNVIGFNSTDIKENYAHRSAGLYNIIYSQGTEEHIGCLNNSVQLVTAAQCAHWFNLTKFFSETERVLTPGGVLAIYSYSLPYCLKPHDEVNRLINQLMHYTLSDYMPKQSRVLYVDKYRTKEFESFLFNKEPIERDEKSSVEVIGTISDLTEYIRNTVTFQNYENIHGPTTASQLLQKFQNDLIEITGSKSANDAEMKIIFNFILLLGRKPF
ncbi:hypothetical protein PGB90_009524 [Kerria lacca]